MTGSHVLTSHGLALVAVSQWPLAIIRRQARQLQVRVAASTATAEHGFACSVKSILGLLFWPGMQRCVWFSGLGLNAVRITVCLDSGLGTEAGDLVTYVIGPLVTRHLAAMQRVIMNTHATVLRPVTFALLCCISVIAPLHCGA